MEKLFYTIGEVAEILDVNASAVRFWTNNFEKFLKPRRNAKGNRQYTKEDIEVLKQIHFLVKVQGLTLEGASRQMAEERRSVESRVKALDALKELRAQLEEVRKSL